MNNSNVNLKKLHNTEIEILEEINRICSNNNLSYFMIGGTLLGAVRHKGFIPWDDDLDIAMPRKDYNKFQEICKKQLNDKFILDSYENNKQYWLPIIKIRNKNTIYEEKSQKNYNNNKGIWVDVFPLDNADKEISNKLIRKEKIIKRLKGMLHIKNLRKIEKEDSILKKILISFIKIVPNKFYHFLINKNRTFNNNKNTDYFVNFGSQYGIKKQIHQKENYLPAVDLEFEGNKYKAPKNYEYVLKKIYGENYMELPPIEKRITHNPIRIKFEDGEEVIFDE